VAWNGGRSFGSSIRGKWGHRGVSEVRAITNEKEAQSKGEGSFTGESHLADWPLMSLTLNQWVGFLRPWDGEIIRCREKNHWDTH